MVKQKKKKILYTVDTVKDKNSQGLWFSLWGTSLLSPISPLYKYLLSTFYVPDTVLGLGDFLKQRYTIPIVTQAKNISFLIA